MLRHISAISSVGLSTRTLKPDSLDPDSMWSRFCSTRHADFSHCTALLNLTHCPWALSRSTARSSDLDRGCEEASLDPDHRSASDPDPRSRVESLKMFEDSLDSLYFYWRRTLCYRGLTISHTYLNSMIGLFTLSKCQSVSNVVQLIYIVVRFQDCLKS